MLYAYCVRRAGESGPSGGPAGVEGARVRLVEADGLGLWVSDAVAGPPSVERLRAHDRVVRAALRSATPLPVRYGTSLADERRARELLAEKREEFLAALEQVTGRVEMGIRVGWQPHPEEESAAVVETGPGRAYLERRRRARGGEERRRREAAELLGRVERFFADLELPTERRVLPEADVAGTLAHLVHRKDMERYRERLGRARNEFFPIEILPSGPWAPYSFV